MKTYWVYFRGTKNGSLIEATGMLAAKWIFATMHNLQSIDYIAATKNYTH